MMPLIQVTFAKHKDLQEEKSNTKFRLCERSSGYGKETQGKVFTPLNLRAYMWKILYHQRSVCMCVCVCISKMALALFLDYSSTSR